MPTEVSTCIDKTLFGTACLQGQSKGSFLKKRRSFVEKTKKRDSEKKVLAKECSE
jgi:hypothetical protein